eukprot:maker-scaffold269_size230758-snap-gene-0.25 protein:Tk07992 transcript:maker-scaffold269_size230758-snap-gene-0.25-mRNA-1 annotation:"GF12888"
MSIPATPPTMAQRNASPSPTRPRMDVKPARRRLTDRPDMSPSSTSRVRLSHHPTIQALREGSRRSGAGHNRSFQPALGPAQSSPGNRSQDPGSRSALGDLIGSRTSQAVLTISPQGKILTRNRLARSLLRPDSKLGGSPEVDFFRDVLMDPSPLHLDTLPFPNPGLSSSLTVELLANGVPRMGRLDPVDSESGNIMVSWHSPSPPTGHILLSDRYEVLEIDGTVTEMLGLTPSPSAAGTTLSALLGLADLRTSQPSSFEVFSIYYDADEIPLPLRVSVSKLLQDNVNEGPTFLAQITAFPNESGLIVVDQHVHIQYCDADMLKALFGYVDEGMLLGKHVETLLEGCCFNLDASLEPVQLPEQHSDDHSIQPVLRDQDQSESQLQQPPLKCDGLYPSPSEPLDDVLTSTPAKPFKPRSHLHQSMYPSKAGIKKRKVIGIKSDGERIELMSVIRRQDDQFMIWLSRDYSGIQELRNERLFESFLTTHDSSVDITTGSLGQIIHGLAHPAQELEPLPSIQSPHSYPDLEGVFAAGNYGKHYQTLAMLGQGANGFVATAFKKSSRNLVVAKFAYRKPMDDYGESNSNADEGLPIEAQILFSIHHPNIVTLLDSFSNPHYHQLVMERHGSGIDLFEFIDRGPKLDENLSSYLFRQVVEAIDYLHSCHILHRDIKDENVIIDEKFHLKLIDFGSACAFEPGQRFTTFCGTVEYCSPDILEGHPYDGPKTEVWALGVLLFVILYFDNPFETGEDIVKNDLHLPRAVSESCRTLLLAMLRKDPGERLSIPSIRDHPWTRLPCDVKSYNFQEIVFCSEEELEPKEMYTTP